MTIQLALSLFCSTFALFAPAGPAQWTFEASDSPGLALTGEASPVVGVEGKAQSLDGRSLFVVEDSAGYGPNDPGFTLTLWVNP